MKRNKETINAITTMNAVSFIRLHGFDKTSRIDKTARLRYSPHDLQPARKVKRLRFKSDTAEV